MPAAWSRIIAGVLSLSFELTGRAGPERADEPGLGLEERDRARDRERHPDEGQPRPVGVEQVLVERADEPVRP